MKKPIPQTPLMQLGWSYLGLALCLGALSLQILTIERCIAELEAQSPLHNQDEIARLKGVLELCKIWTSTLSKTPKAP